MSDTAGYETQPLTPPFLSTFSSYGPMYTVRTIDSAVNPISATFTTANIARYYPMSIPWDYLVNRVFWCNGSTATGNRCFAIYTKDYKQIYTTGSTATSGTSIPQYVTPSSPILLTAGDYYFGFNCSTTGNAVWGKTVAANPQRFAGILQENVGAVTLPDPMTPASASVATVNICGVTWTPSGW